MNWVALGGGTDFFVLEYQAQGYARTNCCAIRMNSGFVIISPATKISEALIRDVEAQGPILALVPPHAGHTLGVHDWKQLRPSLPIFAAPNALPRLRKVLKFEVKDIAEFTERDPKVEIILAPGTGRTSLLARSTKGQREVVYADEILEDLDRIPGNLFIKPIAYAFGKRRGLQVNVTALRFFVKDKEVLRDEVLRLLENNPQVVFAHGPVLSSNEKLVRARELLRTIKN